MSMTRPAGDTARALHQTQDDRLNSILGKVLAIAAAVLCGLDHKFLGPGTGVTTTTLVVVVFAPMWLPTVWVHFRRAVGLMLGALLALLSGALMAVLQTTSNRFYSDRLSTEIALLMFTQFGMLGVLLWARTRIHVLRVGLWFGVGLLLAALPQWSTRPEFGKYLLAVPLGLIVLSLIGPRRSTLASTLTLLALALFGAANDARAYFGSMILSTVILLWQSWTLPNGVALNRIRALALAILAAVGVYWIGQSVLVGGLLGSDIQHRTISQLDRGGNLLLGGRPEWSATISLASVSPLGFGLGATPTDAELMVAKQGLERVGIEASNGYVENYMFGNGIELHSIIADAWAWFGISGLLLFLWITWILFSSLTKPGDDVSVRPLAIVVSVLAMFFLAFGPPAANLDDVMLALAIVLPTTARSGQSTAAVGSPALADAGEKAAHAESPGQGKGAAPFVVHEP